MIDIAEELKTIYKSDLLPLVSELALKELEIYFPSIPLTIKTDQIVDDTFELNESLCSSTDLTLGACEASVIKFRVANVNQDLTGLEFTIIQKVNGIYTMPLGTYTVLSCEKQDDLIFKEIIAYDSMKKTDVDVVTWYNGLTFPITVKNMRISLLTYLGLQYEDQTLTNDTVLLTKTINPTSLLGRDVLKRLCQINAGFGHFTRLNKFKVIQLSSLGLYPSETLYPAEDLFPAESSELLTAGYKSIHYEEYMVEPITKLQISQSDGDEGVVVGTGTNTYVITENYLLYGKTGAELTTIANNILLQIKNKYYRPHETIMVGLPYLEVGDALSIITGTDAIETFIFTRSLRGIQALEDTVTASGNRTMSNKVGLSAQIEQLKGRTLKLVKTVDEVSQTVTNLESSTETKFEQTDNTIVLKVNAAGKLVAVQLGSDPSLGSTLEIAADNISIEGLTTINGNFKVLLDGTIEAVNAQLSGSFTSTGAGGTVTISNGYVIAATIRASTIGLDSHRVGQMHVNTIYLNGEQFDPGLITTIYPRSGGIDSPRNVYLDSNQNLVPSTTSYDFGLGNASVPFSSLHIKNINHKSGGLLGFYGATPSSKVSVSTLASSATLTDVINKINSMINNSHGMW